MGFRMGDDKSKTAHYTERQKKDAMPTKPRKTATITFSLPPEMARELREVARDEARTVSELLREAIRLYMEEREWRRRETIGKIQVPPEGTGNERGVETDER